MSPNYEGGKLGKDNILFCVDGVWYSISPENKDAYANFMAAMQDPELAPVIQEALSGDQITNDSRYRGSLDKPPPWGA